MTTGEEMLLDDSDCPKSRVETLWDAVNTIIYILGAYAIEYLTNLLFPNGMSLVVKIVVILSSLTFGAFALRLLTNEVRCFIKSIARGIYETKRYSELLKDKAEHVLEPLKQQSMRPTSRKRRK